MKRCILICSLVLVLALLLNACGGGYDSAAPAAAPAPAPAPAPAAPSEAPARPAPDATPAPALDVTYETAPDTIIVTPSDAPAPSGGATPNESAAALPILTPSDTDRRIVYTVEMQVQTENFISGINRLVGTVGDLGGYVVSAHVYGHDLRDTDAERFAWYIFRLPTEHLAEFIVIIENNYNLVYLWQASDDITISYEHGNFTLDDLREQEERLKEELNDTELEAFEKIALERELSDVQATIRNLEVHQSAMDDNILYSTINVTLNEVIFVEEIEDEDEEEDEEPVELTFGERFNQAVSGSWGGFLSFSQGFLIVLIKILPVLVVLGIIALITVLIIRKYKKWRTANPKKQKNINYTGYQNQYWQNTAQQQYYDPNSTANNQSTSSENADQNVNSENSDQNAT